MPKRKADESQEDYFKRRLKRYKEKLQKISGNAQDVAEMEMGTEDNDIITVDNEMPEDELPEDFLIALGSEGEDKVDQGPEIRTELANRWHKLMSTGLGKEALDIIYKKYPTPVNLNAEAPKMNPEIFASLSDSTIKRDKRIVHRQNLTGKVMCALGKTLTSVLKGDVNSKSIIEHVNDAAKLCAEIYYQDSYSRKFFALAGANQTVREAVRDCKSDTFLFGTNCAENIKAAQATKKTGSQIKTTESTPQQNSTNVKPVKQQPNKKQGNWRGPSQHYQQRARGGHRPPTTRKHYPQQRDQYPQQRDQKRSYRYRHAHRR